MSVRANVTRILRRIARRAAGGLGAVPAGQKSARFLFQKMWATRSAEMLDAYLVSGFQNPRVNMQSILIRHFLVSKLFGAEFDRLKEEEIRFAVSLNEVLRTRARDLDVKMGSYLDPEKFAEVRRVEEAIADRQDEFQARWRAELEGRDAGPIRILEFACGSANDYRAFVDFGLGPFLDYHGVDLTAKNIENAKRRFPEVDFRVGDILNLPHAAASFDYVVASDIFEHLPIEGMQRALAEATRMARLGLVLTFFNMSDDPEHHVQPRHAYHWNRLSRPRVEALLRSDFPSVTVIPIDAWLKERYDYAETYNRHAYTILAERETDAQPGTRGLRPMGQATPVD